MYRTLLIGCLWLLWNSDIELDGIASQRLHLHKIELLELRTLLLEFGHLVIWLYLGKFSACLVPESLEIGLIVRKRDDILWLIGNVEEVVVFCSPVLLVWEIYDVLAIGKNLTTVESRGIDCRLIGEHSTVTLCDIHVLCDREDWLLGVGSDDE